jgi:hypothetical protein
MTAHLGSKGIALFGSHTTPFKVSIERENFKAIQAPELSKLSAEKVFERLSEFYFLNLLNILKIIGTVKRINNNLII